MSNLWWARAAGAAAKHSRKNKNDKSGAWVLIIIGFFLAPVMIGIPIMMYGFYLLGR